MQLAHRCPKCAGLNTLHVKPRSLEESIYEMVLLRRYACMTCNWPFRQFALLLHVVKPHAHSRPGGTQGRAS